MRSLNKGGMEGLLRTNAHSMRLQTEVPERRTLLVGKGLSPSLRRCPNGPKAPLASDLEFIQDNSLLLPPVPAHSAPGLPAQGGTVRPRFPPPRPQGREEVIGNGNF